MKKLQNQDSKYKVNKFSNSKKKKTILIITIFILILLIIGISYATYDYSFVGKESKLESGSVSIKFLESNTNVISLKNSLPEADKVGKREDSFDFAVTTKASYNTGLKYNLSVEKLSVSSGYTSLNDNEVKIYLTDNSNNVLVEPTLISNLSNKLLYTKTNNHSSSKTEIKDMYKLRVWIDQNVDSSSWTKDSKFEYKFKIGLNSEEVEPSLDTSGANAPVLDSGMIPVYYDETSETWKKADQNNANGDWYDYDSKKWANSVTVSSTNRSKYLSASVGTEIPMDDILTMQVWIPRYKYKVWNYNAEGRVSSDEQQIEITFENNNESTGEITCTDSISGTNGVPSETCKLKETNATCTDTTCNNKTYTHPSFTFGNKEIKGFWVGKFEASATDSLDKRTIMYVEKENNEDVIVNKIAYYNDDSEDIIVKKPVLSRPGKIGVCTILYDGTELYSCSDTYFTLTKPNIHSWTDGTIKLYEDSMINMKGSSNSYGFNTNTDTHMIKNSEWGAVSYLSHSKYGTCTDSSCKEIGINNNSSYTTGCGALSESSSSATCNAYNTTTGMLASTTGNMYGVYDMSGGAYEYTMGNVVSNDGTTMISRGSGFTITTYPNSKYYDKYNYGTSDMFRNKSKLGDGIKEVYKSRNYGWYSDTSFVAYSDSSWFKRGGYPSDGVDAGIFSSYSSGGGDADSMNSSRLIITP